MPPYPNATFNIIITMNFTVNPTLCFPSSADSWMKVLHHHKSIDHGSAAKAKRYSQGMCCQASNTAGILRQIWLQWDAWQGSIIMKGYFACPCHRPLPGHTEGMSEENSFTWWQCRLDRAKRRSATVTLACETCSRDSSSDIVDGGMASAIGAWWDFFNVLRFDSSKLPIWRCGQCMSRRSRKKNLL